MYGAIFIIVVILIVYNWHISSYEDYLYGFWVAEGDDFCDESEIDSMMVFIGEPARGWFTTERSCYIIVMNDICNQGFNISYSRGWGGSKYCISARVTFDEEQIWEDNVKITIDTSDGTMVISGQDTVYARLTKQHDTTNLARAAGDAEFVEGE